jgi:hypothetical protein
MNSGRGTQCCQKRRPKTPRACQNHEKQLETDINILRFPVVSRDFDKPAAFLVPAAFLAALGTVRITEKRKYQCPKSVLVCTVRSFSTVLRVGVFACCSSLF